MDNLWERLDEMEPLAEKVPKDLLAEQASFLSKATVNVVQANIREVSLTANYKEKLKKICGTDFSYEFCIVAPNLGSYSYRAFLIIYGIKFYPLVIRVDDDLKNELSEYVVFDESFNKSHCVATSEEEFVYILKKILNSDEIFNVIKNLKALADSSLIDSDELSF